MNAVKVSQKKNDTPQPITINFGNNPTIAAVLKAVKDGLQEEIVGQFKSKKAKTLSLRELVDYVMKHAKKFPHGMDTQITCADTKGKGAYEKVVLGSMTMDDDGYDNAVVIGYDDDKSMF